MTTTADAVTVALSDLSGHPCFANNTFCLELLQSVAAALTEAVELADCCRSTEPPSAGKLQMQSDLDALSSKLDLNLWDCGLLIKTGVLSDATLALAMARSGESGCSRRRVWELLARLQIGHSEAKHRTIDGLLEEMKEDEMSVLAVHGRTNISPSWASLRLPR